MPAYFRRFLCYCNASVAHAWDTWINFLRRSGSDYIPCDDAEKIILAYVKADYHKLSTITLLEPMTEQEYYFLSALDKAESDLFVGHKNTAL